MRWLIYGVPAPSLLHKSAFLYACTYHNVCLYQRPKNSLNALKLVIAAIIYKLIRMVTLVG